MADLTKINKAFGDARDRFRRYRKAQTIMVQWRGLLECAYRFAVPNREDFDNAGRESRGEEKTDDIFDSTAVVGVRDFANTVQSSLMPFGQAWATLTPGDLIMERADLDPSDPNSLSEVDIKAINEQLQNRTQVLFRNIERSNFNQAVNSAFMDYSVSVGTLVVNEGTQDDPLEFMAIPISHMAYEEGATGKLENFWRRYQVSLRLLTQRFPQAVLPEDLISVFKTDPDHQVIVIEGTIRNPNEPVDAQFLYYVQLESHANQDLFTEVRSYNPFTGFRFAVAPGEILGRGIILDLLPTIRSVNQMSADELMANSWRANPAYMIENNSNLNPNLETLEAGSLITVDSTLSGKDPIRPIAVGGNIDYQQLRISQMQQIIRDALFTDPLGPPLETTNQSATQTNIRQQNSIQKRAAFLSRLQSELFTPVLDKIITILRKKNILKDIILDDGTRIEMKLGDRTVGVNYTSPIIDIQNQQDIAAVNALAQFVDGNFGQQGNAVTFKLEKIPQYAAEKFGVDLKLINDEAEALKIITETADAVKQQAEAALVPKQTLAAQPTGAGAPIQQQ